MLKFKKSIVAFMSVLAISVTGATTVASAENSTNADITSDSLVLELASVSSIDAEVDIGYENGEYFSKNKSTGCTCHTKTDNHCDYNNPGDCKVFASSIQCAGFAKYCLSVSCGIKESALTAAAGVKDSNKHSVTLTTGNLFSYLNKIGSHAYLRGGGHSVFVVTYSGTMVVFYDANYDEGRCDVRKLSLSFADFIRRFNTLDYAVNSSGKVIDF